MRNDIHRRRNSLRYSDYDYAQPGAVFVTICTSGRQHLFGAVHEGRLVHSPSGTMTVDRWRAIPDRFPTVAIDAFVVMPDHVHGIVLCGRGPDDESRKPTVGDVVRWFKASVHAAYRDGVMRRDWPAYDRHLWQRAYHDRIIRSAGEFARHQRYIDGNPGRWWERHQSETADLP